MFREISGFRIPKEKISVALYVISTITAITTLLFGALGAVSYNLYRTSELKHVSTSLSAVADQLKISLILPIWNFDEEQSFKIMESVMRDENISAVKVTIIGNSLPFAYGYKREKNWNAVRFEGNFEIAGDYVERRDLVSDENPIGFVEVAATSSFVNGRMIKMLIFFVGIVLMFEILFVFGLYFLLWKNIILPIIDVERYAVAVSSESGYKMKKNEALFGELSNLRFAIEKMYFLLDQRFREKNESEKRYRALFNGSSDGIFVRETDEAGTDSTFIEVNDAACNYLGYSREELLSLSPEKISRTLDHSKITEGRVPLMKNGEQFFELYHVRKNGEEVPVEINSHVLDLGGRRAIISVVRNISQRKKSEKALQDSVCEKEALIKELYHRTKNNMQVICSLLRLQAGESGDLEIKRVYKEMEGRIMSMALVHQKLYQSNNLSSINLSEYVDDLVSLLVGSYSEKTGAIRIDKQMDDITVLIDTAIPCGLIINELLTNAIKYAFPGERKGTIRILLSRKDEYGIVIQVSDDGVGAGSDFSVEKNGRMGLQTVVAIARHQLGGTPSFLSENGFTCRVEFDFSANAARV